MIRVGAPEGSAGVPSECAVLVDEFGGSADEVGDDGVEAFVVPVLVGLAGAERDGAFDLRERAVWVGGAVVPGGDVGGVADLFDHDIAVPGELGLFHHGDSIGREALFGDST